MLHYTWGTLVEDGGSKVWTFDKREYTAAEFEKQVDASPPEAMPLGHNVRGAD